MGLTDKERDLRDSIEAADRAESWEQGIPTIDDVKDREFIAALNQDRMARYAVGELARFTSASWLHNRVVAAQRRLGRGTMEIDEFVKRGKFDRKFLDLIDPDEVWLLLNEKVTNLIDFVAVMESTRIEGLLEKPMVISRRQEFDFLGLPVEMTERGGVFTYRFEPLKFLQLVIQDCEARLTAISKYKRGSDFLALYLLQEEYAKQETLAAIESNLRLSDYGVFSRQLGEGEAGVLARKNVEIGRVSNIYVRFDAEYLVINTEVGEQSVPFAAMFGNLTEETTARLGMRIRVRDIINTPVREGYARVVNGALLWRDNDLVWHYQAKVVPEWLSNAVGETISNKDGEKTEPAYPALVEKVWVEEYRELTTEQALDSRKMALVVARLLNQYEDDDFGALEDTKRRLENLRYSLMTDEYTRRVAREK